MNDNHHNNEKISYLPFGADGVKGPPAVTQTSGMESSERLKKRELRLLLLEEEETLEFSSLLEVRGLRSNNREEK